MHVHSLTNVNHRLEKLQEKCIRLTNIKTRPGHMHHCFIANEEMIKLISSTIVVSHFAASARAGLRAKRNGLDCKLSKAPGVSSDEFGESADRPASWRATMHQALDDTVRHSMTGRTETVAPEMTIGDLLHLFVADQRDAYPVVSNETLVGIVSMSDALMAFASDEASQHYQDVIGTKVYEVMTRHVMTVEPGTKLRQALQLMGAYRFKSLPVVDEKNRLQGMIAREDIARALAQYDRSNALSLTTSGVGYYTVA